MTTDRHTMSTQTLHELCAAIEQLTLAEKTILMSELGRSISANAACHPPAVPPLAPPAVVTNLRDLTYKIIGCAMAVHRQLGPGYREDTYQRDLDVHFTQANLLFTPQKTLEVFDSKQGGKLIGYYIPDFIVADQVIVEIKALGRIDKQHIAQVIGYMAVSHCPVGLLIDFGGRSLDWRRILPPRSISEHTVNRQWTFVPDRLRSND